MKNYGSSVCERGGCNDEARRLSNHLSRSERLLRGSTISLALLMLFSLSGCANLDLGKNAHEATLIRDDWGVPHIYAKTETAGYYALGYAQAGDQGERVLLMAKMAIGEAASIEGEPMLASDIEARRWMHAEESQAGFAALSPGLQENYRAYATGFNRYFADHPESAPRWRFDFEPWHLIAIPRGLLWDSYMAGDGLEDCRRGGVNLSPGQIASLRRRTRSASNVWVLHPQRTADRSMILLSDPHGGIDGGFCYEFRMQAGGLHSAGYSLGGTMLLAHNESLAWGMTTGSPDVADCYAVETDPAHPLRYQFDGVLKEMTTREVVIQVKDQPPRTFQFAYTHHNGVLSPVVARKGAIAYVISSPYMHDAETLHLEMDRLNRAKDVHEAKRAMRGLGMFAQNLMFADAKGNSWYVRAGRTPRRPKDVDSSRPIPGNRSDTAWQGIHPLDDLVQVTNPPHGYMQNNNVSPDQMTLPPALVSRTNYSRYIYRDAEGRFTPRGVRANEVLSQARNFTIEDAKNLALDEKWPATALWIDTLRRATSRAQTNIASWNPQHRAFLDVLLSFDGHARAGSPQALKYFMWRQAIYTQLPPEKIEPLLRQQWTGRIDHLVSDDLLLGSIPLASGMIHDLFGETDAAKDATLGDLVRIGIGTNDFPVGGISLGPLARNVGYAEETLRAFSTAPVTGPLKPFRIDAGSRLLRLVIFTKPIQSFTLHNFGQSDHPDSPHYNDQARLLTSPRKLKLVHFERRDLKPHIKNEITLVYDPVER